MVHLQMHVIDSIYEWFSSHFLECEYRSSIASIRLVYEVATSHRANLILEYASPPPARRFKWRRKWEVASPCVQIWDATCTRWMTPSSTTVMLGASQGTLLERPPHNFPTLSTTRCLWWLHKFQDDSVVRVCVHRGECMRVYMSACVCTV